MRVTDFLTCCALIFFMQGGVGEADDNCSKSCCPESTYCCVDHVSFAYRLSSNISTSTEDEIVVFQSWLSDNIGNGYSTATGVFTAPAAGLYNFQMTLYLDHGPAMPMTTPQACLMHGFTTRSCVTVMQMGAGMAHHSGTQMLPITLKRGDQVYVVLKPNTVMHGSSTAHSSFSGFLVHPDCKRP